MISIGKDRAGRKKSCWSEFQKIMLTLEGESLRGKMLVTMGFVEDILKRSITALMVDDPAVIKEFATRTLPSVSTRLNLAYLLGIISGEEFEIIKKMNVIRNMYAHRPLIKVDDPKLLNHVRDLARLQNLAQYKEHESVAYVEEVWRMTQWSILTPLMNRPERVAERRMSYGQWELSAP